MLVDLSYEEIFVLLESIEHEREIGFKNASFITSFLRLRSPVQSPESGTSLTTTLVIKEIQKNFDPLIDKLYLAKRRAKVQLEEEIRELKN